MDSFGAIPKLGKRGAQEPAVNGSRNSRLPSGAHALILLLLAVPLGSLLRRLLLLGDDVAAGDLRRLGRGREGDQDGEGDETKHDGPDLHDDLRMLATDGRERQTE